jgi:hypothetical protein
VKDSFYEELEPVFGKFLKYHMKILLGNFDAKVSREDVFKPTIGNESLHKISNDNGVRLVNFATSNIDNIGTIKKNTESLIDAIKEVGLEINIEKTKYMLLFYHKNAGQIGT